MGELLTILNKLEKNTEAILTKNAELENEINRLKEEISNKNTNIFDFGLLGNKWEDIIISKGEKDNVNFIDGKIEIEGNSKYSNLSITYNEKEGDYTESSLGRYILHIEGYKVNGCSESCINNKNNPISEENFNIDTLLISNWKRVLNISIFINYVTAENSKMVITSLKLSKAE